MTLESKPGATKSVAGAAIRAAILRDAIARRNEAILMLEARGLHSDADAVDEVRRVLVDELDTLRAAGEA